MSFTSCLKGPGIDSQSWQILNDVDGFWFSLKTLPSWPRKRVLNMPTMQPFSFLTLPCNHHFLLDKLELVLLRRSHHLPSRRQWSPRKYHLNQSITLASYKFNTFFLLKMKLKAWLIQIEKSLFHFPVSLFSSLTLWTRMHCQVTVNLPYSNNSHILSYTDCTVSHMLFGKTTLFENKTTI